MNPDAFLELRDQLDALTTELRNEARDARVNDREAPGPDEALEHRTRAAVLSHVATRIQEAIVRARPRCHGAATAVGYDEAWSVMCPGGCGQVLDYQRFLQGPAEGRFVDEDNVLFTCQRCGHDLDGFEPVLAKGSPRMEAHREGRMEGLAAGIRAYAYTSSEPWAESGVQYVGTTGKTLAAALKDAADGRYP